MIFLTVGTHEPFDRLVKAVDDWAAARPDCQIFGQIAVHDESNYRPKNFEWVQTLTPNAYRERFGTADCIVSHAGMGSIITALTQKKPILVLPRRGHLRETRNDHQFATVEQLGGRPGLTIIRSESELPEALDELISVEAGEHPTISETADPKLIAALRTFVFNQE